MIEPRPIGQRTVATGIVRHLQEAGYEAYFVGGCVRDTLRRIEPQDFDIATSALPDQVEALFPRTIPVGKKFGVILVLESGATYQVATFRTDGGYSDGRHPDQVQFTSAKEDARRRDFTVNGLFFDPAREALYDWVGGQEDIRAKVLRTIGPARERFEEDHLRLLRAVRFAAQLGFEIESQTFSVLQEMAGKIAGVSAERIREELMKLFRPPHAARGLQLLQQSGLLKVVLPEIEATVNCEQSPDFHPEGSVFVHLTKMLDQLPPGAPELLAWAVLLHDVAKPLTSERDPLTGSIHFYGHEKIGTELSIQILERLKFPRKEIEEISTAVLHHMQFKDVTQMRKATLRRMLLRPTFPLELELHRLDCLGSHGRLDHWEFMKAAQAELQSKPALVPPFVHGGDLMALGMKPGPVMGGLLKEIREKQLGEEILSREEALAYARTMMASGGA